MILCINFESFVYEWCPKWSNIAFIFFWNDITCLIFFNNIWMSYFIIREEKKSMILVFLWSSRLRILYLISRLKLFIRNFLEIVETILYWNLIIKSSSIFLEILCFETVLSHRQSHIVPNKYVWTVASDTDKIIFQK